MTRMDPGPLSTVGTARALSMLHGCPGLLRTAGTLMPVRGAGTALGLFECIALIPQNPASRLVLEGLERLTTIGGPPPPLEPPPLPRPPPLLLFHCLRLTGSKSPRREVARSSAGADPHPPPLFGGRSCSIPQGMILDVYPLIKSLFCLTKRSPNGFFDFEASIPLKLNVTF